MKKALITGITGQDGAYLAEFLLERGYLVHGIKRRTSLFNTDRIDHLYEDRLAGNPRMLLHHGDLTDSSSLNRILERVQPCEIYNLAAQSHVQVSFEVPEYTAEVDGIGTLRLLDAIKETGLDHRERFFTMEEFLSGHEGFFDTMTVNGRVFFEGICHYYPNVLTAMREELAEGNRGLLSSALAGALETLDTVAGEEPEDRGAALRALVANLGDARHRVREEAAENDQRLRASIAEFEEALADLELLVVMWVAALANLYFGIFTEVPVSLSSMAAEGLQELMP